MYVADLAEQFASYVEKEHRRFNHETEFHALAAAMGILVRPGRFNAATSGPPRLITLNADQYTPRRNFSAQHEIGHILLTQSGIEQELESRFETLEDADPYIEGFADLAASLLLMPQPLLEEAHKRYRDRPEAILHLTQEGRVSLGAALRRHVYADPHARRAAFVVSGNYIADVASANLWLPFWRYDRVPEVHIKVPDAELLPLHREKVLGTVVW